MAGGDEVDDKVQEEEERRGLVPLLQNRGQRQEGDEEKQQQQQQRHANENHVSLQQLLLQRRHHSSSTDPFLRFLQQQQQQQQQQQSMSLPFNPGYIPMAQFPSTSTSSGTLMGNINIADEAAARRMNAIQNLLRQQQQQQQSLLSRFPQGGNSNGTFVGRNPNSVYLNQRQQLQDVQLMAAAGGSCALPRLQQHHHLASRQTLSPSIVGFPLLSSSLQPVDVRRPLFATTAAGTTAAAESSGHACNNFSAYLQFPHQQMLLGTPSSGFPLSAATSSSPPTTGTTDNRLVGLFRARRKTSTEREANEERTGNSSKESITKTLPPPPPPPPPPGINKGTQSHAMAQPPPQAKEPSKDNKAVAKKRRASSLPSAKRKVSSPIPIPPTAAKDTVTMPYVLHTDEDDDHLTPYQCLLRKQLELFVANADDVRSSSQQGRTTNIQLGQVGLRCRHCAGGLASRTKGALYYSHTIDGIYQIGQNIGKVHLVERCYRIADDVREQLIALRLDSRRASSGKAYWADRVRAIGVYEEGSILRFRPPVPLPQPPSVPAEGTTTTEGPAGGDLNGKDCGSNKKLKRGG